MAEGIRWGTLVIPVIDEFELTGDPVATPTLPDTGDAAVHFGKGTNLSYAKYGGAITQQVFFTDTELVLHDDTFINIDLQNISGSIADGVTAILTASHNGSPVSLTPGLVNITLFPNRNALDPSVLEEFSENACAVAFSYPEASQPEYKVKGYVIFAVNRTTVTTISTGSYRINFFEQAIWINCPYYNKASGWNTYLTTETIPDPDDPPFDPSTPTDYSPMVDDTSDLIGLPPDPPIGVSNAGWAHVYNPSTGGLVNFGAWLFPNPELPSTADPTEIVNYLLLLCQTLANTRLIDFVLDCHIIPVTPTSGASQDIKVGGRIATGISAPVVTSDYINVSCGALNIREYFGGFQDYICTKSKLFLPFVGFVDMIPEYWQSGTISVDYKFNVIDGSFMCFIRSASSKSALAGSVIAQYAGNACMHIPITGINYANMVSSLVAAAGAVEGGKAATAVMGSAYSAVNSMANGGDMVQSNAYNSTASMLGVRYPYLVIERAVPSIPSTYMHSKGYPANITATLSGVTGFTVIEDIDLTGIPLTQPELDEIRALLKEGVYF